MKEFDKIWLHLTHKGDMDGVFPLVITKIIADANDDVVVPVFLNANQDDIHAFVDEVCGSDGEKLEQFIAGALDITVDDLDSDTDINVVITDIGPRLEDISSLIIEIDGSFRFNLGDIFIFDHHLTNPLKGLRLDTEGIVVDVKESVLMEANTEYPVSASWLYHMYMGDALYLGGLGSPLGHFVDMISDADTYAFKNKVYPEGFIPDFYSQWFKVVCKSSAVLAWEKIKDNWKNFLKKLGDENVDVYGLISEEDGELTLEADRKRYDGYKFALNKAKVIITNTGMKIVYFVENGIDVSYIGNKVCEEYEWIDHATFLFPQDRTVAFRSISKDKCDVSIIAKNMGGGGHPCAAGTKLPEEEFIIELRKYWAGTNFYDEAKRY